MLSSIPSALQPHDLLKPAELQQAIARDADSCVMCGMCLPHCPTYQVYRNEAESPRGRIAIMLALAENRFEPDSDSLLHLDHCLGCMACEAMCPSKVAYGRLVDNSQDLLNTARKRPHTLNWLLRYTARPSGLKPFQRALKWYKSSGLQTLSGQVLIRSGATQLARANALAGEINIARLETYYPARGQAAAGDVALFTGCMGATFDGDTLQAAIKIITRLGYNLHIPETQTCCGALHRHHGQSDITDRLCQQNRHAFTHPAITRVIYTANGCGAQLTENGLPVPVNDILGFILASPNLARLQFRPLESTALIHESCSSRNKLKHTGLSRKALQLIPQLKLEAFDKTSGCCGAGGSHQLVQAELADQLINPLLEEISRLKPDYLLSDNLGCSLHFRLKLSQRPTETLHPVTLLARQLID